jgi:hypothetical protein
MTVYLASPNTQQQAEHVADMPVLLSFACYDPWLDRYQATFKRLLIDSGAFSEFTTGKPVDVAAYGDWAGRWVDHADAIAGLDDISGDWRRSLRNYEAFPAGFPTYHETDPHELLDDLIPLARERGRWIGLGMLPETRGRKGGVDWLRDALDRIPADIHIHGWAMRAYTKFRRIDSVDSTNWWRDAMKLRTIPDLNHLTYGECLGIVIKRYQRWERRIEICEPIPMFRGPATASGCAALSVSGAKAK